MMTEQDSQPAAWDSTDPSLLVVAPPGCGKTEFLALRAGALIPRLRPNQRILALTFTNRAKANLSERLRGRLGHERFRRHVTVRNFHGHAAEIVLAHGRTLFLNPAGLALPTTKTLRLALAAFGSDRAANDATADRLADIKREPLNDDEVMTALAGPGDELALRIERDRIAASQLHYEDLLRHAQRLLRVEQIANLYHQHYGAIIVDEFQDLSLQQLDIVMRSCITWRTFAGDPLQGIYSWAGAAPQAVEASLRKECGVPLQLTVSYRSSPAVLAMINEVSARMGADPLRAHDPGSWPGGGAAAAIDFASLQEEARFIAHTAQQITEANPAASVGIIARSGWRRAVIDKAFVALPAVPCRRWDLAIEDPAILEHVRTAVARMPRDTSIESARAQVVAAIDPSDVDTTEQLNDAFDQLAAAAPGTLRAALAQFRARSENRAVGPGVHLLNAHTGKGQQFDWVFVPGLEEKHIPDRRNATGAPLAEEERVLLVMLSRARHGIVVTKAKTLDGPYGRYASTPSRWWPGLASSATMDAPALTAHLAAISRPCAAQSRSR
jgi:DNA helicase II / ATP-dependent DNA helicase PcrA